MPQTRRRGEAEILTDSERFLTSRSNQMAAKMSAGDANAYVDELYWKVAKRWEERVTRSQFMKELTTGRLPKKTFRLFFKNWAAYTIEINTLEAASYHKHIHFFRQHRDLMAAMAEKLADELMNSIPTWHIHIVLQTATALGIGEAEVSVTPMLHEFGVKIDY